ncbi:hypothetical protein IEQ34_003338 [Dendrobium chrysotoxum]|uniref:Uncharacterized protein n=1 Tax=Dendrobium chrysotoxum TaxID=161865 RepID=A0AAV7HLV5_DENCH|nr:hypothetical protein IEQ34_003338 [Dendrobium chrysotoxum]
MRVGWRIFHLIRTSKRMTKASSTQLSSTLSHASPSSMPNTSLARRFLFARLMFMWTGSEANKDGRCNLCLEASRKAKRILNDMNELKEFDMLSSEVYYILLENFETQCLKKIKDANLPYQTIIARTFPFHTKEKAFVTSQACALINTGHTMKLKSLCRTKYL